jgi:NAD(P)H-dependent FMN reductase/sugar phosphate isomerase/epimerase
MISLIVGTNRPGSNSARIARQVAELYAELGEPLNVIDLGHFPADAFSPGAYASRSAAVATASDAVVQSRGLVIIVPEYNGSYSGALKHFIDLLPFPSAFERRPVAFIGLAAGEWGGLRPVEHLQGVFGYRNAHIYPERVFIPGIYQLIGADGRLNDEKLVTRLRRQAAGFLGFVRSLPPAPSIDRTGVCSWSLQPASPSELLERLSGTGVRALQLHLDPLRENPATWGETARLCAQRGIRLLSGMMTTVGEDYSTLDTIKVTGGVVPDSTWDENWRNFQANARIAVDLGLKLVTLHAGFLPHEESDPSFAKLMDRIARTADLFAGLGLDIAFETGQEDAPTLRHFLQKLNRANVGVNFDPANMLLYDKGDPITAVHTLAPWIKQVHLKDANRTAQPGTWGEEVVVGTGQVDWAGFMRALRDIDFRGNLCLEREAGAQRVVDLAAGRKYIAELKY